MAEPETIQTDVSATNPRMALYEQMKNSDRDVEPEPGDVEPEIVEPEVEVAAEPKVVEPESPVYQDDDGKWVVTRKVNGIDEVVPFSTVMADHQKGIAGDRKLREAAIRAQELDVREKRLNDVLEQNQSEHVSTSRNDLIKAYRQAIYDGKDEEADKAMEDLLSIGTNVPEPAPAIDPNVIVDEVFRKTKENEWDRHDVEARNWLRTEHSDIDKDDTLRGIASQKALSILSGKVSDGQQVDPNFSRFDVDPREVYKEAVQQTTEWLNLHSDNTDAATHLARIDRKRSATSTTPVEKNLTATVADKTPKPQSVGDIVGNMRKARGLSAE